MDREAIINESKMLIKEILDKFCNADTTPYVCNLISTKEGYKRVEEFVLERIANTDDTIENAIMLKERILDPNRLAD